MVQPESLTNAVHQLQISDNASATADTSTSNGVLNGRPVTKKQPCPDDIPFAAIIIEATGLPQDVVRLITDYRGLSINNRFEELLLDPSKLDNSFKEYFMNVLRDTPEKITKEHVIQICQLLKPTLPAQDEYDNLINCQLLTNLMNHIKKFEFSEKELEQIGPTYHAQLPPGAAYFSALSMGPTDYDIQRECGLPPRVLHFAQTLPGMT